MKNKTPLLVIVFALCFNLLAGTALAAGLNNFTPVKTYTQGQFRDVKSTAWYATNVKEAYEYDMINGKSSTVFDPDGKLTLGETVKLAACLHSIYYNGTVEIDTAGSPWYKSYVDYAMENGIIKSGFDNYNRAATRLEFASVFANALPEEALGAINTVEDNAIPDVSSESRGGDDIYLLYRAGILTGNDASGAFTPNTNIVRSEAAAITTRMANSELRRKITLIERKTDGLTAEQISAQCSPAVFYLEVYDKSGKAYASGSGFFITADGVAVTNYHVIDDAASAKIMTTDGKVYNVKGVYDYNEKRDIALLQIDGNNFSYLNQGKGAVTGGMTVYAIGSPKGLNNTISQGLVSNASRLLEGQTYIQTSAPISKGSSGGALLNSAGEVIGITSAVLNEGQNLNFAIPISAVDSLKRNTVQPFSSLANAGSKLTVATNAVSVAKGSTATVMIGGSNDKAKSILYSISGKEYVSCQWGDWDSSYSSIPLYIKGLAVGTANIKVYEVDADGKTVGDSITLNVTVGESGKSGKEYYDGYYPAVDFGSVFEVSTYTTYVNDDMKFYLYDAKKIPAKYSENVVTAYADLLKENGFVPYDSFYDDENLPVVVLRNKQYGVYVYIGLTETAYSAYLTIGLESDN